MSFAILQKMGEDNDSYDCLRMDEMKDESIAMVQVFSRSTYHYDYSGLHK